MIGRLPLWMMLLPLVAGVAIWAYVWRGQAAGFEADLARVLPPNSEIEAGGFPYRLEVHVQPVDLLAQDVALKASLKASEATINRVPWQPERQVINLGESVAEISLAPIQGAIARIASPEAQASLRLDGGKIARLSILWEGADIQTGLFATPATAKHFEVHLRETPSSAAAADTDNPRPPTQAQLVLAGESVRFGHGDPLKLELQAELTATSAIRSLAAWTDGGTAEVRQASIHDATGEVASLKATIVSDGLRGLMVAGTIETVCPASVRAAMAGLPPISESRTRKAETIAFQGSLPGKLVAAERDPKKPPAPVRGQEPPCPRLR
ncbi:DUF2125 domain-containing protein [Sandaracinobacteroides hominis]|uniref:DUF2125 domain-containing protein n=1 Tax=Sandaracinobacteroides hominis TaxID=2780086 RepID=UPI0018F727AF|nr:DUF2125 domain-containing protein [Sandaracinobacteroides hominis]